MSNLIVGNKYVPKSKSTGISLEASKCWKRAKDSENPYLYYNGLNSNNTHLFHNEQNELGGDYFLESDVIPYEEEFVLPEAWYVVVTRENRDVLSKWRFPNSSNMLEVGYHTGIPEGFTTPEHDRNNYWVDWINEITFEQFKTHVLKEFVLPEKWCIKSTPETFKIIGDFFNTANRTYHINCYSGKEYENDYFYSHNLGNGTSILDPNPASNFCENYKRSEFTEITLNEFKKHILKSNNMKQIGWKFKEGCEIYKDAAIAIGKTIGLEYFSDGTLFNVNSSVEDRMKKANVLDVWFEPVFKEEFKVEDIVVVTEEISGNNAAIGEMGKITIIVNSDKPYCLEGISFLGGSWCRNVRKATSEEIEKQNKIEILGYKAEKTTNGIKFGCQTIAYSILDSLEDLMSRSEFTVTLKIEEQNVNLQDIKKLKNL